MGKVDDIIIKAENYNKTSILLTFKSGEQRVLDINWLFITWNDPHLSCAMKQRWKKMYDNGDFFNYEIQLGDLVWPGWVEVFAEDIKEHTIEFDIYKHFEKSEKIFVHYGSKHFDNSRFMKAHNRIGCDTKPDGGLWGSPINSNNTWIDWCIENEFRKYDKDDCFYFRLDSPWNWITIHNKDEWELLPKREDIPERDEFIDFEAVRNAGIGDGYPLEAIETAFEDYDEYSECFLGYDCDSVIVLDDSILIENYDAKYSSNPLTLEDLKPICYFTEIRKDVFVSCLLRSPDDKVYVYVEEPDAHYGFKILVACISDGRIVEIGGYSEEEGLKIIEEIKPYKKDLESVFTEKRVLLAR